MKNAKRFTVVLLSLAMLVTSGCGTCHVAMSGTGEIDKNLKLVAKGKVHVFPPKKSDDIASYRDGLTNLDQEWTEGKAPKPAYVTEGDIVSIVAERAQGALRQAGYDVTYGETAPKDAEFTVKEYIESLWICPTHPNMVLATATSVLTGIASSVSGFPVTELVVNATFSDAAGDRDFVTVGGRGRSYLHLSKQGGFDTSMEKALANFQENLVKGMVKFQKISKEKPAIAE